MTQAIGSPETTLGWICNTLPTEIAKTASAAKIVALDCIGNAGNMLSSVAERVTQCARELFSSDAFNEFIAFLGQNAPLLSVVVVLGLAASVAAKFSSFFGGDTPLAPATPTPAAGVPSSDVTPPAPDATEES